MSYATDLDRIARLELQLMQLEEQTEPLDTERRKYEMTLRLQIETEWEEDKSPRLSNEKKRQIAYEALVEDNPDLQHILAELKDIQREQRKLRIEIENEKRAFQLKVNKSNEG